MQPIHIFSFSDVLCIWAYIAQVRVDELKTTFQDQIKIEYHFVPVFCNAHYKLEKRWRDRGGFQEWQIISAR
jgi:predicted DsbA family dithiol-disulfide isomerase